MKDKLKNIFEHEVELLGRSISILAIAGLLLIGGGSAALLTSFGTVDGNSEVTQAITINGGQADDESSFGQEFSISDVTAGEAVQDSFTVENNLDSAQEVYFDSQATTTPGSSEDTNVEEGTAYEAGHLLLDNGESFTKVEPEADGTDYDDSLEASADYIYSTGESQTALKASFKSPDSDGHVHSGLWFDVEETNFDDAEVEVETIDSGDYHTGSDWIYVVAADSDGDAYVIGKWNYDSATSTFDADQDYEGDVYRAVDDATADSPSAVDISNIDSRSDFEKEVYSDNLPDDLTVHYAVTATGTNQETSRDPVAYTDVKFNDGNGFDSLVHTVDFAEDEAVDVPAGQSEVGTAIDFGLDAYPGKYGFETAINPESGN